ncbi:hypothetical protein [Mycobacterium servetii]|uniref:Uncharacterized protein n=1 Tax=Mycobacterium servetii TaxID=3237418 RepID=A0ABV4C8A4_9MYCO
MRSPASVHPSFYVGHVRKVAQHLASGRQPRHLAPAMYRVPDRLHGERTVRLPAEGIAPMVSAWLAELGAHSPLVDDLAGAACAGNWALARAVGDQLSVEVVRAA